MSEFIHRFSKKYFKNTFFLNAPLLINTLLVLVVLPVIISNLPVADYGKFQLVLAIQIWLMAFTAVNITRATKRGIAKGLNGTFLYGFLTRLKLVIPLGILVLGVAIYFWILKNPIFPVLLAIIGLYLVFGYLFRISFYDFLIAKKRFKEWCFWQIFIFSISIIGSALVAYSTKNVIYFASFQLGSITVLSWIAALRILVKENVVRSYKKGEIDKECVNYGLKLIPVDLVSITSLKISHFIIGPFFGFSNLAIFSVADKLRDKCISIIKSARPLLYADFAKMERNKLIKIINRYLIKLGIIGFLLNFGLIAAGWFYIKFFLPETFHSAIIYFVILAFGLPLGIMSIILHTILESHLRYKELSVIGIISSILKIVFIIIFGYFWQTIGICIAWVVSSLSNFLLYYFLTFKANSAKDLMVRYPILNRLSNF